MRSGLSGSTLADDLQIPLVLARRQGVPPLRGLLALCIWGSWHFSWQWTYASRCGSALAWLRATGRPRSSRRSSPRPRPPPESQSFRTLRGPCKWAGGRWERVAVAREAVSVSGGGGRSQSRPSSGRALGA